MTPAQALLNFTDELICTVNTSGKILEGNTSWRSFFSNCDIATIHDLFNLEFTHEISKLLSNESFTNIVLPRTKIIHPKGEVCWVTVKIQLLTSGCFLFILKNETEEKKLSELLNQITESFEIGHFSFDSETQKLHWSSKVYEFFEEEEGSFKPSLKYFIHAFGDKHIEYLNNLFNSPLSRKIDVVLPFTRPDGNVTWLNIKARKTFSTPISYSFVGVIKDVTKEKQREIIQLSQNVELSSYEKGMEKFSIIARTDSKGKIIYANDEFCKISKYSHDELIGQDHRILNSNYHPKEFFESMWRSIREGVSWRGEIRNKAKDGSFYWVDTVIIPIMDSEGYLNEIVSFRYDITSLKQMHASNKIYKNKLELIVPNQNCLLWDFSFEDRKLTIEYKFLEFLNLDPTEEMNLDVFISHFQNFDSEKLNRFIASRYQMYLEIPCSLKLKDSQYNCVLKFRLIRNELGEAIHLDGLCELTEKLAENIVIEAVRE